MEGAPNFLWKFSSFPKGQTPQMWEKLLSSWEGEPSLSPAMALSQDQHGASWWQHSSLSLLRASRFSSVLILSDTRGKKPPLTLVNVKVPSSPDLLLWKFCCCRQNSGSISERSKVSLTPEYKDNWKGSSHLCAGMAPRSHVAPLCCSLDAGFPFSLSKTVLEMFLWTRTSLLN